MQPASTVTDSRSNSPRAGLTLEKISRANNTDRAHRLKPLGMMSAVQQRMGVRKAVQQPMQQQQEPAFAPPPI